jgi:hypothetical protein
VEDRSWLLWFAGKTVTGQIWHDHIKSPQRRPLLVVGRGFISIWAATVRARRLSDLE